jgi:tetratricopeptide (TPR) repeat protein
MRLAIYRGDAPDRYVDLAGDVRIGRAHENDVVLEDPDKGVSRFHAELRQEHGRFVIVDLNSQNGVWLRDRRVSREIVEPGAVIMIGPYRLLLDENARDEDVAYDSAGTLANPPSPQLAQPMTPAPPVARQPQTYRAPMPVPSRRRVPTAAIVAAVVLACVVIVAVIADISTKGKVPPPIPPVVVTTLPPTNTVDEEFQRHVSKGKAQLESEQADAATIQAAMDEFDAALKLKPNNEEARGWRAKAEERLAGLQPVPPPALGSNIPPTADWPKGLPRPGKREHESMPEYRKRADELFAAYNNSKSALERGDFPTAIQLLKGILEEEQGGYQKAAELLREARIKLQAATQQTAQQHMADGRKAEQAGELAIALQQYQKAHDADPALPEAGPAIEKLRQFISKDVGEAYKNALWFAQFKKKLEERDRYEYILKLLLPGDPRRKEAEERLAVLRGAK